MELTRATPRPARGRVDIFPADPLPKNPKLSVKYNEDKVESTRGRQQLEILHVDPSSRTPKLVRAKNEVLRASNFSAFTPTAAYYRSLAKEPEEDEDDSKSIDSLDLEIIQVEDPLSLSQFVPISLG